MPPRRKPVRPQTVIPAKAGIHAASQVPAPARFRAGAGTVQTCYIAPSTAFTSSSTAAAESNSPLKWAVTTS